VLLATAGIGLIIALAVAAIAIRPAGPPVYEAGSPEAAFQSYLVAFEAADYEAAHAAFSGAITSRISVSRYRRLISEFGWAQADNRRFVLDGVERAGDADRATLRLRIDTFNDGLFGGDQYSYGQEIPMVREDGTWKIDELLAGVEPASYALE
jgi:hypothetical protein